MENQKIQSFTAFLVDDDPDDQKFFQMAARRTGMVILCEFANDGIEGLEKCKRIDFKPDIIFIDINMPRMNGMELLTAIQKIEHLKKIPVYMYTTSAEEPIRGSCIQLGAKDVIKKFPSVELLRDKLANLFSSLNSLE